MRIALSFALLAACLASPAFAATASDPSAPDQRRPAPRAAAQAKRKPAQPAQAAPRHVTNQTAAHPARIQRPTELNTPPLVRVAHPIRPAPRAQERLHPGLGGPSANTAEEAAGFCGTMQMPPLALRQISRGFSRGHSGIDLMAPHGSPARAAAAGTVIYAGRYYAYGNIVDIRHADGVVTRYAHLSAFAPEIGPGSPVAAGEEIGKVGATGHAHGPHVHFEVRLDGRAVDPRPYLGLASCDPSAPREEILEAYAGEPRPARRPAARARSTQRTPAQRPPG